MTALLLALAVAAAARGVWSPCGLSMLSTITPIGERGRGNRYAATAAWYAVGSAVGGLTLGLVVALGAALVPGRFADEPVLLVAALVAVASDLRLGGFQVPIHRRQVNERWLDVYRPWVYGGGFGWQVGSGFATYIMTAANHLLVVGLVARGSVATAVATCGVFGLVRGVAVLLTRSATSPAALLEVHERVHRVGPACRWATIAVEGAVAVGAAATVAPWLAAAALAAVGGAAAWSMRSRDVPVCSLDVQRLDA